MFENLPPGNSCTKSIEILRVHVFYQSNINLVEQQHHKII